MSPEERERVLRVIDANLNRAVEALRVVEEHARFVRCAPQLAGRLQALRRDVHRALDQGGVSPLLRLAARDVAGDPLAPSPGGAEPGREGVADLVLANVSRAKEALRALEEWTKLLAPAAAGPLGRVRYAVYALEAELLSMRPSLAGRHVHVILGEAPGRPPLVDQARACLGAGVRLFQLRLKDAPGGVLVGAARALVALLDPEGALLVVDDRPDVARVAGAHGVHVGQQDLPPDDARRVVGPSAIVGASAHDAAELAAVLATGAADYVGFGTLFASPTKPDLTAQGVHRLASLAPTCPLPIYGIGGVTAANAAQVIAAGAHGVAVSSAVLDAPDIGAAVSELVRAVDAALAARPRADREGP